MNLTYAYIFLAFAIVLEITGTSFVKDTAGFTKWIPTIICLVTICFSYYLMSHVVGYIPVGITYATWSGLGIAAITIIGIFKYCKKLSNFILNFQWCVRIFDGNSSQVNFIIIIDFLLMHFSCSWSGSQ